MMEAAIQMQVVEEFNLYQWILLLVSIIAIGSILFTQMYTNVPRWLSNIASVLKSMFFNGKAIKITGIETLDEAIEAAGYSYDSKQDIFYSNMDGWQRSVGYCRLYDESAAPMGMIIDCEPIYFSYGGKRWLIELWKGQYDLTTGCEIGVYTTQVPDLNIAGVFKGPFFECASNTDRLLISYSLKKKGRTLFTRKDKHWWLTGFKLGEFSEPSELTMDLKITLKDRKMRDEFVQGLKDAGYLEDEIIINGNTVALEFDKTRTPQPITRTKETDWIIQRKNELMCGKYQEITGPYDNFPDKIKAIQEQAPELFEEIINIGKNEKVFKSYKKIKKYLD